MARDFRIIIEPNSSCFKTSIVSNFRSLVERVVWGNYLNKAFFTKGYVRIVDLTFLKMHVLAFR